MLEVLLFPDSKHSLTGKKLSWTVGNHTTAASYIEVPISKHALTGKRLSWTVWELLYHITPTSYILSPIPSLYHLLYHFVTDIAYVISMVTHPVSEFFLWSKYRDFLMVYYTLLGQINYGTPACYVLVNKKTP